MPIIVLLLSIIPIVGFGIGSIAANEGVSARSMVGLIDYTAVALTFSAGAHWAFGLASEIQRAAIRLVASLLALAFAWAALYAAQVAGNPLALGILIAGYLVTMLTEHQEARRLQNPVPYLWLRWGISAVALVTLAIVLILRGIGQTFVF